MANGRQALAVAAMAHNLCHHRWRHTSQAGAATPRNSNRYNIPCTTKESHRTNISVHPSSTIPSLPWKVHDELVEFITGRRFRATFGIVTVITNANGPHCHLGQRNEVVNFTQHVPVRSPGFIITALTKTLWPRRCHIVVDARGDMQGGSRGRGRGQAKRQCRPSGRKSDDEGRTRSHAVAKETNNCMLREREYTVRGWVSKYRRVAKIGVLKKCKLNLLLGRVQQQ